MVGRNPPYHPRIPSGRRQGIQGMGFPLSSGRGLRFNRPSPRRVPQGTRANQDCSECTLSRVCTQRLLDGKECPAALGYVNSDEVERLCLMVRRNPLLGVPGVTRMGCTDSRFVGACIW